jgi:hypothetical protein
MHGCFVEDATHTGGGIFCPDHAGQSRPDASCLFEIVPHCLGVIVVIG